MKYAIIAIVIAAVLIGLVLFGMSVGYNNSDARFRNLAKTKQEDNNNEYDAMWKKIAQVAEVTEAQKDALKDIFEGYAKARTGSGEGGSVAKWIQESVPHVDTSTFNNLQNIIVSSRDRFTQRQKELLDIKREHDNLLDTALSRWFISNTTRIDVQIVTSTRTKKAFETGVDDDVNVFKTK